SFPATRPRPRPILRDRTIDPSRRSRDKGRLSRGGVPARVPLGSPTTAGRAGASWVSGPTVYWTPPRDSSPRASALSSHKVARHGARPMPPPMAGSGHRHAAIDVERLAGDVGGVGAGEIDRGGCDIVGEAKPRHRDLRQDARLLIVIELIGHRGRDDAGRD